MKFKKSLVEKIVKEELQSHMKTLLEETEIDDAQEDNIEKDDDPQYEPKNIKEPERKAKELDIGDDVADDDIEKDVAEPADDEENDGDNVEKEGEGGQVVDEVVGKTIQSITSNKESKMMPGGTEIEIQFQELDVPLKIIISATGEVKYFIRSLYNEL